MKQLLMALLMTFVLGVGVANAATISNTGPGSDNTITESNECNVDINNDTDVDINVDTDQDADSGDATNSGNTSGGNSQSGDANNDSNVDADVDVTNDTDADCDPCDDCSPNDPSDPTEEDPGVGGGDVEGDQVVAPVGGVSTGGGGALKTPSAIDVLGLVASFGLVAAGFWRARKSIQS